MDILKRKICFWWILIFKILLNFREWCVEGWIWLKNNDSNCFYEYWLYGECNGN